MPKSKFEYDIAVSFAGENRATVEEFATLLRARGKKVFYDLWEQSDLWGKDLYQHLDKVYGQKARFCVVFISAQYAAKAWTNHELKSAQARAFTDNEDYLLPVRLDDTVIPGIRPTLGYIDLRQKTVGELAALTLSKLDTQQTGPAPSGSTKGKVANGQQARRATNPPQAPLVVDDSQEWVFLNGQFCCAESVNQPDDRKLILSLATGDTKTNAALEALKSQSHSARRLPFAFASDAFLVRWSGAQSTYEAKQHKWTITLEKEDVEYGGSWAESSFSGPGFNYSAEDFVNLRARRILLGERPAPTTARGSRVDMTGAMVEAHIQGMHAPLKVTSCPIQEIARTVARDDAAMFMRFARLVSMVYLKAGGVVERIERLAFGPLTADSVHVAFRGYRRKRYSNTPPAVVEFEGDCPLPPA